MDCFSAEALVDVHGGALYKLCRSITYTREDADDLFQDTFIRAFEHLERCEKNPRAFLFAAAVYIAKSNRRKYARRSRIAPLEPLDDLVAQDVGPEQAVISSEERQAVICAVENLPPRLRTVVKLHYGAELSISEVADALKIPQGTVKSRLHKARKLLEKGLSL